jgi:hypothetical protein
MRTSSFVMLLIVAGIVIAAMISGNRPAATPASQSSLCANNGPTLAAYLKKATGMGLIRPAARTGFFEVDEPLWAALSHDQKINVAGAAFCDVAKSGKGTVILTGLHDGKDKASIVDGNYSD